MTPEIDLGKGVRGLHHIPSGARVLLRASIERSVWEYFSVKAEQSGIDLVDLLTDVLERDIEINGVSNGRRVVRSPRVPSAPATRRASFQAWHSPAAGRARCILFYDGLSFSSRSLVHDPAAVQNHWSLLSLVSTQADSA